MRAGSRSKTVAFVAIFALATFGALATASAGPSDRYYEEGEAKAKGVTSPAVAQALHNRALAAWREGKFSEAEGLYKRALAIRETALGANHPDVGQTLNNLALVYADQSKHGEAEELYKRALAIREKALGANHRDVGQTLHNLAYLYWRQGKYSEAEGPSIT
jgi:tetratricopeptide (TPR) repeat protein